MAITKTMESKKVEFFNRLSFIILISSVFLSLFFFLPYVPVTLGASKGFLISIGMALSLFFWLIARLGEGTFSFPKERLIIVGLGIVVAFLIASFFSSSHYVSLFGSGFEIGTFGSMLILFILFFLSSLYFQTEKRLWRFFNALFLGAFILAVFELFHIFVGFDRILPGMLNGVTSGNLVGSWNDFGLFFGLITILSLFTLEFLKVTKLRRVLHYFLLVSGIIFLILINVPFLWLIVGLFAVLVFVYNISLQQADVKLVNENITKKFPFTALSVVFICLIFLVGNNLIGSWINQYINIYNPDVRPSITSTVQIAYKALKHNPVLGTGPNTFSIDWALWQPKIITQTVFWDTDFPNGFGFIPTLLVTTGILGFGLMIWFLVYAVKRGIRAMKFALTDSLSNYFVTGTIIIALYSWVSVIVYMPNIIMFGLAFASTGILIGILVSKKAIKMVQVSFLRDPRSSFFAILGLMAFMMGTLFLTYVYIEKFSSLIYFSRSLQTERTFDGYVKSEKMLRNAIMLDRNDMYYRALSQVYISQIGSLLNNSSVSQDTLKTSVQQLVNLAEESAGQAVSQNPKQYLNYVALGNMYTSLVPLSVSNSYESAIAAYNKAHELAPYNPSIYTALAQLELAKKNNTGARAFLNQALELKSNYTDAIFLLAQIDASEGNLSGAIKQAEYASTLSPNDSTVFFRLGLLRYTGNDYSGAVSAFERAVILNTNYLNARYYLALAYQKVGRTTDATAQLNLLKKVLPGNQDIENALKGNVATQTPTPTQTTKTAPKKATTPLKEQQ